MDCKRAKKVLILFADDELEAELVVTLERHLSQCPPCAEQVVYVQRLRTLIRERCTRQNAPPRLRSRILKSLPHRQSVYGP